MNLTPFSWREKRSLTPFSREELELIRLRLQRQHALGTDRFRAMIEDQLQRRDNDLLTREINLLRTVVADVRRRHPFRIHGWVVLPDHLHWIGQAGGGLAVFHLPSTGGRRRLPSRLG